MRSLQLSPLFMPAVALTVGILLGDCWGGQQQWWVATLAALASAVLLRRSVDGQSIAILLCFVALGGLRSASVRQHHDSITWPEGYVRYEAVVVSEVAEKPKTFSFDALLVDNGRKIKCYIAKDDQSRRLRVGDRLLMSSRIERNSTWRIGSFDYRRYMEVHGFSGRTYVWAGRWQSVGRSWQGLSLWQRARLQFLDYRHQLLERYRQMGASEDEYAVVAAMTLGDKTAMTRELKDVYSVSGASHVLALSGLHLGIIYMMLSLLVVGRRFRVVTQPLIVVAIWAFVLLTGLPTSVVRAAVMISLYALLLLFNRSRASLNALSLAAICILIVSPDSLFDVGFQLSFAAMLAIILLQPKFERLIPLKFLMEHPLLRWVWGLTAVSLAAQLGVAPLVAYYFGRFSTYFLLTNFIVIPAATAILYLALAALLLPIVAPLLVWTVAALNSALSHVATTLPCASIEGLRPSVLQTVAVYIIIISTIIIVDKYAKHS
jgi:competence protein ComEC